MINCLIVDDEPLARQVLKGYILASDKLSLVKDCSNALEAFGVIANENVDLMFLDIQMPSLSGIDLISSLKNPPAVIFTTAFAEYAVRSYELNAVDYLLKPITYERFELGVSKYLNLQAVSEPFKPYFYFKVNGKMIRIQTMDILYVRSVKDYVIINTAKGNYITHMTLKYVLELLPGELFKQVHRSFVVGTAHISAIGRYAITVGEHEIQIGEKYRAKVEALMI